MLKNNLPIFIILLIILLSFYCKENKAFQLKKNDVFFGDPKISLGHEGYFKTIVKDNGYLILKKQAELYNKKYSNFDRSNFINSTSQKAKFKFIKQRLNNKNYRIVLYTYLNNMKKDSIEFYRNYGSKDVKRYTCLSYLDLKTNKIWQIKFFYNDDIILYESNNIKTDGKIKSDSLYYLDESLDVEMGEYHLYY